VRRREGTAAEQKDEVRVAHVCGKSEAVTRHAYSVPVLADGKIIGLRGGAPWRADATT
jgi:hypothetical protein